MANQNPGRSSQTNQPVRDSSASTRERILLHLREHRVVSAVGLSLAWGLTREDIRYHLNELLAEGVIEVAPRAKDSSQGRGRPAVQYRLAMQSAPDNFPRLCALLLAKFLHQEAEGDQALRAIAEGLAGEYSPQAAPARRLNQAVALLNAMQYHARWEAHAKGPRILLRNCPYAAILKEHPELCKLDQYLLEKLCAAPAMQSARINFETAKPPACIFQIQPSTGWD